MSNGIRWSRRQVMQAMAAAGFGSAFARRVVAEEPVKEPAARPTRAAAREVPSARADDTESGNKAADARPESTARTAAGKLQRPVWSPFRP